MKRLFCKLFGCRARVVSDWTTIEELVVPLRITVKCDRCGQIVWAYERHLFMAAATRSKESGT